MSSDEKTCPDCAETIKAAARKCKHCGYEFFPVPSERQHSRPVVPLGDPLVGIKIAHPEVEDILAALVDRSLASFDLATGRYSLLESVRQYGAQRLKEEDEWDAWSGRHLSYWRAVAEESEPRLQGPDAKEWLERLDPEHDNMRAAMEGALRADRVESGLLLALGLSRYWRTRGFSSEGRKWLDSLLAAANAVDVGSRCESLSLAFARAMSMAGRLAGRQGDYTASRSLAERSLVLLRELGDQSDVTGALMDLGNIAYYQGDYGAARGLYEEGLSFYRSDGDSARVVVATSNLGLVAQAVGDLKLARIRHTEALTLSRELGMMLQVSAELMNCAAVAEAEGDLEIARKLHKEAYEISKEAGSSWHEGMALHNLGSVECMEHDYSTARPYLLESLRIFQQVGDKVGICYALEGLAGAVLALDGAVAAARIWGTAERLRETIGAPPRPSEAEKLKMAIVSAREDMQDEAAFEAAWTSGREMRLEQSIALLLADA